MIFFAVDFMATNVANQPIPRHPISEGESNPAVRRFSLASIAVMPGFGPAIHASSDPPIRGRGCPAHAGHDDFNI